MSKAHQFRDRLAACAIAMFAVSWVVGLIDAISKLINHHGAGALGLWFVQSVGYLWVMQLLFRHSASATHIYYRLFARAELARVQQHGALVTWDESAVAAAFEHQSLMPVARNHAEPVRRRA